MQIGPINIPNQLNKSITGIAHSSIHVELKSVTNLNIKIRFSEFGRIQKIQ